KRRAAFGGVVCSLASSKVKARELTNQRLSAISLTKGPRTNNLDSLTALRKERVVPVRMKNSRLEIQFFHFRVLHFNPRRIMSPCKSRLDLKSGFGFRVRNQINDSLIADQRSSPPVLGDERKHAMLDLVPFAGTWRKMRDMDL